MTHTEQDQTAPDHGRGHKLHVQVLAPRSRKPKRFTWDEHMLVQAAADDAARAFGYHAGTPALSKDRVVLDPTQSLHQAGVRDGDTLELLDKGGGV